MVTYLVNRLILLGLHGHSAFGLLPNRLILTCLSVHLMLSINLVRVGLTSLVVICSGADLIRLLDIASQSIGLSDIYSEREDDIHADRNSRFWLDYLITGNFYSR